MCYDAKKKKANSYQESLNMKCMGREDLHISRWEAKGEHQMGRYHPVLSNL